ncbi:MAG: deoxyribose-phosphate aldolase [Chloroflexi bacterium]|nr:deoxyribose-phosphate aldolase [Chloroflexota bacterium]
MSENVLSQQQIARMIDISAVQAPHGEGEIRDLIARASVYGFGSVHVLPAWVTFARELLPRGEILLGAPVGFPSGGHHSKTKRAEAQQLVADGVDELDMMLNVGKLRSGAEAYVLEDIRGVVGAVNVPVKVILETHYLTDEEIRRACELCITAGAQFVKTSTGWAASGATLHNITLITGCVAGRIGVKASGGIRDLDTLVAMYRLGVRRFGINADASVAILRAVEKLPGGVVRM